jgi:AraC-like DNA-binding protein
LAAQDLLAELVDEAMAALGCATAAHPRRSSRRDARRRDTVEAAKLHLTRAVGCPPSLSELAAALDCSPFHLSRIFRATTGLSLRQYLRRLRAQIAADRLRRGDRDLTSLALELGFYDHSHFTKAFRREWGLPPSQVRSSERTRTYKRASTQRG